MTVKEYIDRGTGALLALYPKEESKALLKRVLEHFCQVPPYVYYTDPNRLLPFETLSGLKTALDDLAKAKPIQYILGEVLFEGCTIKVGEGVLIPRPETAELVRWAKSVLSGAPLSDIHILDLCTGSGAIAIALAKAFPLARVFGVDVSEKALEIAKENSLINKVEPVLLRADIFQEPDMPCLFDMVICNPPYVRVSEKANMHPSVLDYEPHSALFVPDEDPLLYYRALANWCAALLEEGGLLMTEMNEYMYKEVETLLREKGFSCIEIRKDLNGKPRMCAAVKSSSRLPGSRPAPYRYQ